MHELRFLQVDLLNEQGAVLRLTGCLPNSLQNFLRVKFFVNHKLQLKIRCFSLISAEYREFWRGDERRCCAMTSRLKKRVLQVSIKEHGCDSLVTH